MERAVVRENELSCGGAWARVRKGGGGGAEVLPSKFTHQTRMTEWTEIEELQDKKYLVMGKNDEKF